MVSSPTLFCTDEPNDADLVRTLGSAAVSIPIASGDVCFSGCGEHNPILVCCERKKVGDLASCILTGRYLHQLQIAKSNGADVFVLILEGRYRRCPDDGLLEVPVWGINSHTLRRCEAWQPVKPAISFSRFDQYLTELAYLAGVIVKRSENVRGTADVIEALYCNFQKPPGDHNSLKQMFKSPVPIVPLVKPSLVRRVAAELPGVGWEWSRAAEETFAGSVAALMSAGIQDWKGLTLEQPDGRKRRLGAKIAAKIVHAIRGKM